jgi:hypothetical protein
MTTGELLVGLREGDSLQESDAEPVLLPLLDCDGDGTWELLELLEVVEEALTVAVALAVRRHWLAEADAVGVWECDCVSEGLCCWLAEVEAVFIAEGLRVDDRLRDCVWLAVGSNVADGLEEGVGIADGLEESVGASVRDPVGDGVRDDDAVQLCEAVGLRVG